jgi:hypothetical protein
MDRVAVFVDAGYLNSVGEQKGVDSLIVPDMIALADVTELVALVEAFESTRQLPRQLGGRLLATARTKSGKELDSVQKKQVRSAFVSACRERISAK